LRSLSTGSNDVFVIDQATINEYDIEDEVVFPTIGGRDITRWYTPQQDKYILYMTPDADLDETPGAKAYLEANREELESRYCVKQGKHWYQLARHRPGIFAREKVITPDICYYNNFFHDKDTEFHALNSAYVLYADNLANNYLVGVLNSDAVQFYMRRTAPQYGNDYLRYVTSYLFEIPIPDPENNEEDLVQTVKEASDSLRELAKDYREAKDLLEVPEKVYERTSGVEISTLSFAGYIDAMNISDEGGDVSATADGDTVRLNVQDTISFVSEREAVAFESLLQAFEIDSVDVLEDLEVPKSTEGLLQVVDTFEEAERLREEAVSDTAELEETLNDAVYKLYGFDDEHRELIEKRIDKPEDLLEAKVRT
jgi:hypothetical protein